MTEYEIIDLLQQRYAELGTLSTQFFTLVSAYVVAAYLVADKLSRLQLAIVTALYVVWTFSNSGAVWNAIRACRYYLSSLDEMGATLPDDISIPVTLAYLFIVQGGSILASLYFMWSRRRHWTGGG